MKLLGLLQSLHFQLQLSVFLWKTCDFSSQCLKVILKWYGRMNNSIQNGPRNKHSLFLFGFQYTQHRISMLIGDERFLLKRVKLRSKLDLYKTSAGGFHQCLDTKRYSLNSFFLKNNPFSNKSKRCRKANTVIPSHNAEIIYSNLYLYCNIFQQGVLQHCLQFFVDLQWEF